LKLKNVRKGVTIQIIPMPFRQSLVFFAIPALVAVAGHYMLWPFFMGLGVSEEYAYHYQALIAFTFLIVAALVAYVVDGNPIDWPSFKSRFRLFGLDTIGWTWTIGGITVEALLSLGATVLAVKVYDLMRFTPPEIYPSGPITNLPLLMFVLSMNIVSEELWWRGYILPRQEMQHGRYTWVIHGVLWAFFHAFKWWAVPFMLITTWITPFVCQRTKNTTPGFIIHFALNGLGILLADKI
jgi:membrane protease YdiL (CAAX protease family)